MNRFSGEARDLLWAVSGHLDIVPRPFKAMAEKAGLSERALIARLKALKEDGMIRRVGAVLDHKKIGFRANALVAWQVDTEILDMAGEALSAFKEVSHCYARDGSNLSAMTLSTGRRIGMFFFAALSSAALAVSKPSLSSFELPIAFPLAFRKV